MDKRIEEAIDAVVLSFNRGLNAAKSEARGDHVYYASPVDDATDDFKKSLTTLVKLILNDED